MHVGTGRGVLLSDPDTHNAAVGCNVTDPCETRGEFLCPKDRSTCVSSWNATSCLCRPGLCLILRFAGVVKYHVVCVIIRLMCYGFILACVNITTRIS